MKKMRRKSNDLTVEITVRFKSKTYKVKLSLKKLTITLAAGIVKLAIKLWLARLIQ